MTPGAHTAASERAVFDGIRTPRVPVPRDSSVAAGRVPQVVLRQQLSPHWLEGSRVG